MNKLGPAAAIILAVVSLSPSIVEAATAPVPCEKMLVDVKAALETAQLGDADKAKVMDLESQGIERCKADDDAGADAFFAQAMTIMDR